MFYGKCMKYLLYQQSCEWSCQLTIGRPQLCEVLGMGYSASEYLSYDDFDAFLSLYLFLALSFFFWPFCPAGIARPTYRKLWEKHFFHPQHKHKITNIPFAPIFSLHCKKHIDTHASPNTTNKAPVSCNQCWFRDERNNELLLCYHCLSQCHVCVSLSTNLIRFNTR